MLPPVVAALKEQKAQQAAQRLRMGQGAPEPGKDFVFTGTDGGMFNITFVRDKIWYKTLTAAKLRRRVLYQSTHSFASNAMAAGENPTWIADMMGDTLETVLKAYTRRVRGTHNGSDFVAKMEGEGHVIVHQARHAAEQNA